MKTRIRRAVLKILLLQEEFTKQELAEAVGIVADNRVADLIDFLSKPKSTSRNPKPSGPSVSESESRVIKGLRETDSAKYGILKEIDSLLRTNKLLGQMNSIRKIGTQLDKGFDPGKSRKDAVPRFVELLASLPIEQLEEIAADIVGESHGSGDDFEKLANYLIHGRTS